VDDVRRLQTLRLPVLLVTGTLTAAFHRRINEILAARLPVVECAELPGDHHAISTAREAFISRLRKFLAARERPVSPSTSARSATPSETAAAAPDPR
jgi:hypothetical protein